MTITITHVLEHPGDKRTLCGEKRDGTPRVWAPFVKAHQDGHGLVLCAECREIATNEGIAFEPEQP